MMDLVYLSGPIADCTDEEARGWRNEFAALYPNVLDPMARDYRGRDMFTPEELQQIVDDDKRDIDNAAVVVVWYRRPSVGTSMEVLYAWERGKRVVIIKEPEASMSPWLWCHCAAVVNTIAEAIAALNQVTAPVAEGGAS